MRGCATTRILATSREGLGVAGERLVAVQPLPAPLVGDPLDGSTVASVELFVDRARSADATFELNARNRHAVARLCRRLDGLPFAIELAAARVAALSPDDILERLDQRFRLLAGGARTSLAHHQTLRRTVEWSYELLDDRDRTVFDRLSVFAGTFDLAAAEAVAADGSLAEADVTDAVVSLVAKSMLTVTETPTGRRYRLLETLRDYGRERLAADRRDRRRPAPPRRPPPDARPPRRPRPARPRRSARGTTDSSPPSTTSAKSSNGPPTPPTPTWPWRCARPWRCSLGTATTFGVHDWCRAKP